ncbi:MAG TPA: FG-GAP-like repeat-containing protein [Phycisphaerae bacterium]|nr:FG-GAP-like repeat-containing protein [Phycisphaerae bacterium]
MGHGSKRRRRHAGWQVEALEARELLSGVATAIVIQQPTIRGFLSSVTVDIFTANPAAPVTGGQVTLSEGSNTLAVKSAAESSRFLGGAVSMNFTLVLAPGVHSLVATYAPDAGHTGSSSAATSITYPHYTLIAEGSAPGQPSSANVVDATSNSPVGGVIPFGLSYRGGVNVALGDVDGDGVPDLIVSTKAGGAPLVEVFNILTSQMTRAFYAFNPSFHGGVSVAAGDVNGDGKADIIVGAGAGGGPQVEIFSGANNAILASYYAFSPGFSGGIEVAAGDVNGDGHADVAATTGAGVQAQARVFSGDSSTVLWQSFLGPGNFLGGAHITLADVDNNGKADLLSTYGSGGAGVILRYTPTLNTAMNGFVGVFSSLGAVGGWHVGVIDTTHNGRPKLVAAGPLSAPIIADPFSTTGVTAPVWGGVVNDSVSTWISA